MNNSANFAKIKKNFKRIEKIIEMYTNFNKDDKCMVELHLIENKNMFYLTVKWNEMQIEKFKTKTFTQLMYIFYNEFNDSYIVDISSVKLRDETNKQAFKDEIKREINKILSKNKENEI